MILEVEKTSRIMMSEKFTCMVNHRCSNILEWKVRNLLEPESLFVQWMKVTVDVLLHMV